MDEKTMTAIEEQARPAGNPPAGGDGGRFRELLALAAVPDDDEIEMEDEDKPSVRDHAWLDQFMAQHRTPNTCNGGDVDDILVQLFDRAAGASRPQDDLDPLCFVDRVVPGNPTSQQEWWAAAGPDSSASLACGSVPGSAAWCVASTYLPQRDSVRISAFFQHGDSRAAREVVRDLLHTNVFATVRPEIAKLLIEHALSRPTIPQEARDACAQAVSAMELFPDSFERSAEALSEPNGDTEHAPTLESSLNYARENMPTHKSAAWDLGGGSMTVWRFPEATTNHPVVSGRDEGAATPTPVGRRWWFGRIKSVRAGQDDCPGGTDQAGAITGWRNITPFAAGARALIEARSRENDMRGANQKMR